MCSSDLPTPERRLDFLARETLARPLQAAEIKSLVGSAERVRAKYAADAEAAAALVKVGESPADPALPAAELATWTVVASQFLNLDEFLNK